MGQGRPPPLMPNGWFPCAGQGGPLRDDYEREFTAAIVGHASPTLESMLLNAADSLDIGRVTEFDFKYFPFLRGGEQEGPKALVPEYQNLRQALHEEADLLARMTDPLTQTRDLRMKLIQAGEAEDMVYVQRAASEAVAGQLALDAEEDFLAFVEGKIRAHPDMFRKEEIDYMDVSPRQIVSVGTAMIPLLL